MTLRIGSLCSGYGGLDMAVAEVLGAEVAWHCQYDPDDKHQYAAAILAHHWPDVPNHGDITTVDFTQVEPVDVLTAGFPCQDLSLAGKRAGIAEGTRSGLWLHVARAVEVLRPRLVVIENVRGILSQSADRGMEPRAEDLDRTGGASLVLRALGAVLGDLAGLGLDAEWAGVQAAEILAPHERFREFILAFPRDAAADADDEGGERAGQAGREPQRHVAGTHRGTADASGSRLEGRRVRGRAAERGQAAQDADLESRRERRLAAPGQEEERGARPDARRRGREGAAAAADAEGDGRLEGRTESAGQLGRSDVAERGRTAHADADGRGREGHGELPDGRDAVRGRVRADVDGRDAATADADGDGVRVEPVGERRGGGAPVVDLSRPGAAADAGRGGRGPIDVHVHAWKPDVAWGDFEPAVRRWEAASGSHAPRPTDDRGRLDPLFVEWMMGVPRGHVTGVPAPEGMTAAGLRNARLKALGNGVVPPQAAAALRYLLTRMPERAVRRLLGLAA